MLCRLRLASSQVSASRVRSIGSARALPLLNIDNADVFELGAVKPIHKSPFTWRIEDEGQSWAVVGDGKDIMIKVGLTLERRWRAF